MTTPIANEDPSETSQSNTNKDLFVLDTSSLYSEKSPPATRGKSLTPIAENRPVDIRDNLRSSAPASPRSRASTRSSTPVHTSMMQVDDDYDDENYYKRDGKSHDERYLTIEQFNYTMNLLDGKINSIYKLLRHVSNQQQKDSQTVQKLAVVDELSDEFWNVSYFNIFLTKTLKNS